MAEQDENKELSPDLQEYAAAEEAYQQKFGRSLTLDLVTLINSQELQELQQNDPTWIDFIQNESGKYVPIAKEYIEAEFFADDEAEPVAEEPATEEAGRPAEGEVEPTNGEEA